MYIGWDEINQRIQKKSNVVQLSRTTGHVEAFDWFVMKSRDKKQASPY
jgi:hypothetical protein